MPDDPGEPVVTTLVCSTLPIAREAAGASCTRHSLRPLISWGEKFPQNSGALRGEIAEARQQSWRGPSFETPRKGAAPQDEVVIFGRMRRDVWRAVSPSW
jgi:hypothetical protein